MRRLVHVLLGFAILAGAAAVPARARQPGATPSAPAAAIRDVVARYVEARETRDAGALAALFTADADQLVSSGEWRRGRDAVVKGGLASSARNSGSRTIAIESVRLVTEDVAIADGRYEIAGEGGGAPRRMWTTFVMQRTQAGWRISAIRNMRPSQ